MSYRKKHLDCCPTLTSCFSLALLLFTVCFGWLLPISYGQENGPVEWLQVVVLGLAALVALSAPFQNHLSPARRKLFALSSIGLLLAIARELSWGRALYMDSTRHIPSLKALWFGPYVYPGIALVAIAACGYFFSQGLHKELIDWLKYDRIPVFDLIMILGAILAADMVEHHSAGFFGDKAQVFEELGELISYTGILSFMINIVFNQQFHADKTPKLRIKG